jgi:hypothetical protein
MYESYVGSSVYSYRLDDEDPRFSIMRLLEEPLRFEPLLCFEATFFLADWTPSEA